MPTENAPDNTVMCSSVGCQCGGQAGEAEEHKRNGADQVRVQELPLRVLVGGGQYTNIAAC